MQMDPLSQNIAHLFNTEPVRTAVERFPELTKEGGSFANVLTEAFSTAAATDLIDKTSSFALMTGEADDLSGMLLDMQKAELSLQLALQIRNKIMDAYNEVMRMSI